MYVFMLSCYVLMFVNVVNLTLTGTSGYFNFDIFGASHTRFALFMILIFTITETIVMYFFITTGKFIFTSHFKKNILTLEKLVRVFKKCTLK